MDVPGRLLWNVHKMSRMKKIIGSGTPARGYHRDLDEDSRCRQEGARGDWHPVRPSAWGEGVQMVRRCTRGRECPRTGDRVDAHNFQRQPCMRTPAWDSW